MYSLLACCRKQPEEQVSVGDILESIGESRRPETAHAVFQEALHHLDRALAREHQGGHEVQANAGALSADALRVLRCCGFERGAGGAIAFPHGGDLEGVRVARDLIICLVSSHVHGDQGHVAACKEEDVCPPPLPSTDASCSSRLSTPDPEPARELADRQSRATSSLAGEGDEQGLTPGAAPVSERQDGLSDRELAERLQREEMPQVLEFQRFRHEDRVVDASVVEEINRHCAATGERYVDPQFPPLPRSLYLSEAEAESWECISCRSRSPLPPVPALPASREEAQRQKQEFQETVKCVGCGSSAPYVVQVRYFTRPTQWLRPGARCEGCELVYGGLSTVQDLVPQMCTHFLRDSVSHLTVGAPWKLIRESARPEDVCQGGLGNCWFAAALSIVAQIPELIDGLFLTKEFNPHGAYHVRLCHAGSWHSMVLDDLFPTSQIFEGYVGGNMIHYSRGGSLCYLQGARRQLWVPLVEKAAAKLFGCYGSLRGGTFGEALALLTGFPTQRLRLYVRKAEKQAREQRRQAREARRTRRRLAGVPAEEDSEDSDHGDDITWSSLVSCKEAGYLMGMGCTEEGCEKTMHHIVEEMGLQAPHAYGILDVREASVGGRIARLLKIRNPWGERAPRTWQGDWGKDSDKWTPELKRELGVVNSSGVPMDDPMSIFWMSFEDAKEYFAEIEICRVHVGWSEVRQRAWLPSGAGPGEAFELTVSQKTRVDFSIWQEKHVLREGALGARSTNVDVGLAVLRDVGAGPDGRTLFELVEYVERACLDDVSAEAILDGGHVYRLVPVSFCQIFHASPRYATVAVHSVHPVELKKIDSSWTDVATATLEGTRRFGSRWADQCHRGVEYFLLHEGGGCSLVAENYSDAQAAVQADASDSVGCVCSPEGLGTVALLPPRSRTVVMTQAFQPGAPATRARILPQPVPVEMAPQAAPAAGLHAPLPLPPPGSWRRPETPPCQVPAPGAGPEIPGAPASGHGPPPPPPAPPRGGGRPEQEDEQLAAALRLSLQPLPSAGAPPPAARGGSEAGAHAQRAGARQAPPLTSPLGGADRAARAALQARAKELFAAYRAQGVAPNEAARRAGEEARRDLGAVAV